MDYDNGIIFVDLTTICNFHVSNLSNHVSIRLSYKNPFTLPMLSYLSLMLDLGVVKETRQEAKSNRKSESAKEIV